MANAVQTARLDYSHVVLEEIIPQLGVLRQRTNTFVNAGDRQSESELLTFVKSIAQTLELINCRGASLLTQELLLLLDALAEDKVADGIDAAPVLILATEKLSEYLDYLRSGGLDIPLALLPLLNDMRACRNESLLSEALIVAPVFDIPESSDTGVRGELAAAEFFTVVRKTKLQLMQCVLRWFRNHTVNQNLRKLVKLLDALEQVSPSAALQDLWLAARALCVSLLDDTLEDSVAVRVLFAQMERFVSQLSEQDFQSLKIDAAGDEAVGSHRLELPSGLFKNMLYYVALSKSNDDRVVQLQQRYRLQELLPPRAALDSARDALGSPNARLSDAICASIQQELVEIKTTAGQLAERLSVDHPDISDCARKLDQMADTFQLLGVQNADGLCRNARDRFQQLAGRSPTKPSTASELDILPELASELLQLESMLEAFRHSGSSVTVFADSFAHDMLQQRRLSSFHLDRIISVFLSQAREVMAAVEHAYVASVPAAEDLSATSTTQLPAIDTEKLLDCQARLNTVKQALQILPLPEVLPLLTGAEQYLQACATDFDSLENEASFADLLVNTRTYLDEQILKQSASSDLLANAEQALLQLQQGMQQSVDSSPASVSRATEVNSVSSVSVSNSGNSSHAFQPPLAQHHDDAMLKTFTAEALQQFEQINSHLSRWQLEANPQALSDLRRCYHTLKGSGYVAGATAVADFAAANETLLETVAHQTATGVVTLSPDTEALLHESAAVLPQLIYALEPGGAEVANVEELNARLYRAANTPATTGAGAGEWIEQTTDATSDYTATLAQSASGLAHADTTQEFDRSVLNKQSAEDDFDQTLEITEAVSDLTSDTLALHDLQINRQADSAHLRDTDATLQMTSSPLNPSSQSEDMSSDQTLTDAGWLQSTASLGDLAGKRDVSGKLDDTLSEDTMDGSIPAAGIDLDSTLYVVYEAETRTHLLTLRRILDRAMRQKAPSMPDEALPRTLHTMNGSARAAEVGVIAELVNPLEAIASYRLRTGRPLELTQWSRFAEVVDAIEYNLDLLGNNVSPDGTLQPGVGPDYLSAETLGLQDFVNQAGRAAKMEPSHHRDELTDVFMQEAGGLIESMQTSLRELNESTLDNASEQTRTEQLRDIMRPLHTLKGSARVCGSDQIADLAHVLETSLLDWQGSDRGIDATRLELLQESIDALTLNLEQATHGAAQGDFDLLISSLQLDSETDYIPDDPLADNTQDATDHFAQTLHDSTAEFTDHDPQLNQSGSFDATRDDLLQGDATQNTSVNHLLDETDPGQTLSFRDSQSASPSNHLRFSDADSDLRSSRLTGSSVTSSSVTGSGTGSGTGLGNRPAEENEEEDEYDQTLDLSEATNFTLSDSDANTAAAEAQLVNEAQLDSEQTAEAVPESIPPATADSGLDLVSEASLSSSTAVGEQVRLDASLLERLSGLSTDVSLHHTLLADGLHAFGETLTDLDKTTARLRDKLRELDMETDMSPVTTQLTPQLTNQASTRITGHAAAQQTGSDTGLTQARDELTTDELATADTMAGVYDDVHVSDADYNATLDISRIESLENSAILHQAVESDELELDRTAHINPMLADHWRPNDEDSRQLSEILTDLDNIRDTLHAQLRLSQETLSQTSRFGSDIHEALLRSRLVRFDLHRHRLGSLVRQTARSLGKQVELELLGGETTVDRDMHKSLVGPLVHLLSNAVSHGIEVPELRREKNKAESGKVTVEVKIVGSDLCVDIADDGAGIDFKALRRATRLPSATDKELLQGLFTAGVSTAESTSQISGRGIGLESTAQAVAGLGGRVELVSTAANGTTVRIRVPQRVVINQVVLVEHNGCLFGVPVNFVRQVVPVNATSGVRQFDGLTFEPVDMSELDALTAGVSSSLSTRHRKPVTDPGTEASAEQELLVEAAGRTVSLRFDRVMGYRELITKPVGRQLSSLGFYSGVSLLASGRMAYLLDVSRLLESDNDTTQAFGTVSNTAERVETENSGLGSRHSLPLDTGDDAKLSDTDSRSVVLVVDDSVTMRTYTSRILQDAGFDCEVARDGLEALDLLDNAESLPRLVLLDIEMPRMDGFKLLELIRSRDQWQDLPIVMISSRTAQSNRARASALGVLAYLGKPYQAMDLLEVVEKHIPQTPR